MGLTLEAVNEWQDDFHTQAEEMFDGVGRREVVAAAISYTLSLLRPLPSKNGWTIAEEAGYDNPQAHQRLLRTAQLDRAVISQRRRRRIVEDFGAPEGLFILDDTGFAKAGEDSVGVQRQYSGTLGKVDNCQIGVFAAYASPAGHVLYDGRLYLPKGWAGDEARRAKAGVPDEVEFATKPQLALEMVDQALADGLPMQWVTADCGFGQYFAFRQGLIDRQLPFVLEVRCTEEVWTRRPVWIRTKGRRFEALQSGCKRLQAQQMVASWGAGRWRSLSVGEGSKGHRIYQWAAERVVVVGSGMQSQSLWLLARRHPTSGELAYYLCFAPPTTALATLARVAAGRWQIEECFEEAKGQVGLDDYQVRKWESWHRHIEFAMLAHLVLADIRRRYGGIDEDGLELTVHEIRRLFQLALPPIDHTPHYRWRWSIWRRRHNYKAKLSHYRARVPRAAG